MTRKIIKGVALSLVSLLLFCSVILGAYSIAIPEKTFAANADEAIGIPFVSCAASLTGEEGIYKVDCRLFGMIPIKTVTCATYKEMKLYPGGMPFGIKFATDGVMVVGFCDVVGEGQIKNPAREAGLKQNDMIKSINGRAITSVAELSEIVEKSGGKPLSLEYERAGKKLSATLTPAYSSAEGKYKTGAYVKDGGAGIGTVTFIDPETYSFGGLGHGVCDASSGKLVPMKRGSVTDVTISGVVRGEAGKPGEVKGYFSSGKTGSLLKNSDCGVFGVFGEAPDNAPCEPMPVGLRDDIREGEAYIYCTLDSAKICKYRVQISSIDKKATGNKCFTVRVTDKALLEKTGGIVQGMSGSPIIQDGKLVGAVTHVLINDPTTGYGIFIENMLDQMGELAG